MEKLQQLLCSQRVLRRPDYTRPFHLRTDWSQDGVGAVLSQHDEAGQEFVVAFASRSCNDAERNYNAYDGESLAVVWAIQHFRHYLIDPLPFADRPQGAGVDDDHFPAYGQVSSLVPHPAGIWFQDQAHPGCCQRFCILL